MEILAKQSTGGRSRMLMKQPHKKFLDAWDQKSEGLELIKGHIMDENHIVFAQDNTIYFWTTKGIGLISINSLI
jgi:hypothetical protein